MKSKNLCPKCGGSNILRIEDGRDSTGVSLYLGFMNWTPVARYVCTDCGYVESWVNEQFLPELTEQLEKENRRK